MRLFREKKVGGKLPARGIDHSELHLANSGALVVPSAQVEAREPSHGTAAGLESSWTRLEQPGRNGNS